MNTKMEVREEILKKILPELEFFNEVDFLKSLPENLEEYVNNMLHLDKNVKAKINVQINDDGFNRLHLIFKGNSGLEEFLLMHVFFDIDILNETKDTILKINDFTEENIINENINIVLMKKLPDYNTILDKIINALNL